MPTPRAIVPSGSTLVSSIVTGPFAETENGLPVVASCATAPANVSVVVAGVGGVVVGEVEVEEQAPVKKSVKTIDKKMKARIGRANSQDPSHANVGRA